MPGVALGGVAGRFSKSGLCGRAANDPIRRPALAEFEVRDKARRDSYRGLLADVIEVCQHKKLASRWGLLIEQPLALCGHGWQMQRLAQRRHRAERIGIGLFVCYFRHGI